MAALSCFQAGGTKKAALPLCEPTISYPRGGLTYAATSSHTGVSAGAVYAAHSR
jgi:hypothetical protein